MWDHQLGVWVGNKAVTHHESEVPSPLCIFGYGSLCWRPEGCLVGSPTAVGRVRGWRRVFVQRSTDHRGTPQSPGLVVSALQDTNLESLGLLERVARLGADQSEIFGVVYFVPEERTQEVLDRLDFREKGGYTRMAVDVELTNHSHVRALLYSANNENPNFAKFMMDGQEDEVMDQAATIISSSVGPSGENKEYLFNLANFLRSHGVTDNHVNRLEVLVSQKLANKM